MNQNVISPLQTFSKQLRQIEQAYVANSTGFTVTQAAVFLKEMGFIETEEVSGKPGVYMFIPTREFNKEFLKTYTTASDTSSLPKRPKFNKNDHQGFVFYLGKSDSNLQDRINKHKDSNRDSSTYALHLGALALPKSMKHWQEYLTIKTWASPDEISADYVTKKILLSTAEHFLHESLRPMIGSKRT